MPGRTYDPFKIYKFGDAELTQRVGIEFLTGQVQDYQRLKAQNAGRGFVDPEFPHDDRSIGKIGFDSANKNVSQTQYPIVWLRAKDALANYRITYANYKTLEPSEKYDVKFSHGCCKFDVRQGGIGNCFFVASLAAVTSNKKAFEFAVPSDNNDDGDSGVYHFRLWHKGVWVDVVVDDYIPFNDHGNNNLMTYGSHFAPNGNQVEIWVQLAEKAYAKLNGGYGSMSGGGFGLIAMQELTGGFSEAYSLSKRKYPRDLFDKLKAALAKDGTIVGLSCKSRNGPGETPDPTLNELGLCYPHAYTVVQADTIKVKNGLRLIDLEMVKLYNPHGTNEWKGAFSDDDGNWQVNVSKAERDRVKFESKDNGEFWMPFQDMVQYFEDIQIISILDRDLCKAPVVFESYEGSFGRSEDDPVINIMEGNASQSWSPIVAEVIPRSKVSTYLFLNLYSTDLPKPNYPPQYEPQIAPVLAQYPKGTEVPIQLPTGKIFVTAGQVAPSIPPAEGTKNIQEFAGQSLCLGWKVDGGEYTIVPSGPASGEYILRVFYVKSG